MTLQAATVSVEVDHVAWATKFARHEVSKTRLYQSKQNSSLVLDGCVVSHSLLIVAERRHLAISRVLHGIAPSQACKLASTNTVP